MTTKTTKRKKSIRKKKSERKKLIQPVTLFVGTEYEKKIMDVCYKNKYPFAFRRAKIRGKVVDFINRDKRLIIEVYNPERNWEEVQARLKVFLVQRFKTKYITLDRLSMRNWRNSCKTMIEKFLK